MGVQRAVTFGRHGVGCQLETFSKTDENDVIVVVVGEMRHEGYDAEPRLGREYRAAAARLVPSSLTFRLVIDFSFFLCWIIGINQFFRSSMFHAVHDHIMLRCLRLYWVVGARNLFMSNYLTYLSTYPRCIIPRLLS